MEKMIKVLWFDDEHKTLEMYKEDAQSIGIELIGFSNAKDGIKELQNNISTSEYSAILLDGKFLDESGQDVNDISNSAFGSVAKFLLELKAKNIIFPWFVFSGQTSFIKEKNDLLSVFADRRLGYGRVFEKNKEGFNKLCKEIIKCVGEIEIIRIRTKYSDVFECFGDKYLPIETSNNLIEVLLSIENNSWSLNSFPPLRKVIEAVYSKLNEYDDKLLPYGCLRFENNQVNFKLCELRLTGKDIRNSSSVVTYHAIPKVLPDHLGNLIGEMTRFCSVNAHIDHKKHINSYTLKFILFYTMNLVTWFKSFVDEKYNNTSQS